MRLEGATLEGCLLTTATVNEHGVVLLDSLSRITNSTILVVEGGTGVPINAASALSVSAVGNRYNNRAAAVSGLGANVTNVGAGANLQTVKGIDADTAISARVDASATGSTVAAVDARLPETPASEIDVYHAVVFFNTDGSRDEYTVQWFCDGAPLAEGVADATIQVVQRATGADLIEETPLAAVGETGAWKLDETMQLQTPGEAVLAIVAATIDGQTRLWREILGRDAIPE